MNKAYVIQAGREIRVMVNPDDVNDDSSFKLAQDIAKQSKLRLIILVR